MNRVPQIMKKNLLLLFRNRSSAFVILLGPLFIILLIGLAFMNASNYEVAVGYYANEPSSLTDRFLENMQNEGFIVESFLSINECTESIKQGTLQTCILFPENFSIEDGKTNEIIFYVDQTRTNFVYQIIDTVSTNLGLASEELSEDLTNSILDVLQITSTGVNIAIEDIVMIKASTNGLMSGADSAVEQAENMDLSSVDVETDDIETAFDAMTTLTTDLREQTEDLIDDGKAFRDLNSGAPGYDDFNDAINDIESFLEDNENEEDNNTEDLELALDMLIESLDDMSEKLDDADESREETVNLIDDIKDKAKKLQDDLDDVKSNLEKVSASINGLQVTSSETITNPITTRIEPISTKNSKLSFMFPYLLMLVVMFVGLLLSATLIMMEKNSKSSFRTFCTPVKEELLMVGNFLTSFMVVIAQMVIVVSIAYYLLRDALLGNIAVALLILFLGIVFFIILGMAIGYLLNSQEGVTMISISIVSVFLFLSNLILPLETLSPKLQLITAFNPYVLTSEALRKALLFNAPIAHLARELWLLVGLSILVFGLMIIARDIMKSQLYFRLNLTNHNKIFEDPTDLYLKVDGHHIKNLREFLDWLESVDDKTCANELTWKELRIWMKKNHLSKILRIRLAGKNRLEMIEVLEKRVENNK